MVDWRDEEVEVIDSNMFNFYTFDDPKYWPQHIVLSFCDDLEYKSESKLSARMILNSSNEEVTTYSVMVDTFQPQRFVDPQLIFTMSIHNTSPSVVLCSPDYYPKHWVKSGKELIERIKEIIQLPETQVKIKTLYTAAKYGDVY